MPPTTDPAAMEPLLIPSPKSLTLTGRWVDCSALKHERVSGFLRVVQSNRVTKSHSEWYRLQIGPSDTVGSPRIEIQHTADVGERRAHQTLDQLIQQYGFRLPELTIEDRPAFGRRGVMLDV